MISNVFQQGSSSNHKSTQLSNEKISYRLVHMCFTLIKSQYYCTTLLLLRLLLLLLLLVN